MLIPFKFGMEISSSVFQVGGRKLYSLILNIHSVTIMVYNYFNERTLNNDRVIIIQEITHISEAHCWFKSIMKVNSFTFIHLFPASLRAHNYKTKQAAKASPKGLNH